MARKANRSTEAAIRVEPQTPLTDLLELLTSEALKPLPQGPMARLLRANGIALRLAQMMSSGLSLKEAETALRAAARIPEPAGSFWRSVADDLEHGLATRQFEPEEGDTAQPRRGAGRSNPAAGSQPLSDRERSQRLREKREERGEKRLNIWLGAETRSKLAALLAASEDGDRERVVADAISAAWRRWKRM